MKRIFFCLLGCMIFSGFFGQQTNISYTSSHGISYRYLYPDKAKEVDEVLINSYINDLNIMQSYFYSNQHVLSLEREFSSKISSNIGIGLQRKSVIFQFDLSGTPFDPRHGFEYNDDFEGVDYLKIAHRDYYLVLPIHLRYNFIEKNKLQFYGSFGIKTHLHLKSVSYSRGYSNDEKIVYRNKNNISREEYKLINPALEVALGFDYRLNDQFSLRTNVLGDIDISSNTTKISSIDQKWYALYLSIGLVYSTN